MSTTKTTKDRTPKTPREQKRDIAISITEREIAAVRDITKVDAVAPAVLAIVRKAIELHAKGSS